MRNANFYIFFFRFYLGSLWFEWRTNRPSKIFYLHFFDLHGSLKIYKTAFAVDIWTTQVLDKYTNCKRLVIHISYYMLGFTYTTCETLLCKITLSKIKSSSTLRVYWFTRVPNFNKLTCVKRYGIFFIELIVYFYIITSCHYSDQVRLSRIVAARNLTSFDDFIF